MTDENTSLHGKNLKKSNHYLVDAELLPLFEKAKNGCLDAQIKLIVAFGDGEGAKKNENLAQEFEQLLFNTTDDNNFKLATFWNPAVREHERGNHEAMIEKFHIAIDFMQENIPMEKWDFSLFVTMEELTQSGE